MQQVCGALLSGNIGTWKCRWHTQKMQRNITNKNIDYETIKIQRTIEVDHLGRRQNHSVQET